MHAQLNTAASVSHKDVLKGARLCAVACLRRIRTSKECCALSSTPQAWLYAGWCLAVQGTLSGHLQGDPCVTMIRAMARCTLSPSALQTCGTPGIPCKHPFTHVATCAPPPTLLLKHTLLDHLLCSWCHVVMLAWVSASLDSDPRACNNWKASNWHCLPFSLSTSVRLW
jgi:hypothetical protein